MDINENAFVNPNFEWLVEHWEDILKTFHIDPDNIDDTIDDDKKEHDPFIGMIRTCCKILEEHGMLENDDEKENPEDYDIDKGQMAIAMQMAAIMSKAASDQENCTFGNDGSEHAGKTLVSGIPSFYPYFEGGILRIDVTCWVFDLDGDDLKDFQSLLQHASYFGFHAFTNGYLEIEVTIPNVFHKK